MHQFTLLLAIRTGITPVLLDWSNTVPKAPKTSVGPTFISLYAAGDRIGYGIHTMRDKVATGELRAYRISDKPGSAIRVKVADVDALMKPVIPAEVYPDATGRNGGAK